MSRKVILIVLDAVGAGAAPDADRYGDAGADTLGHVRLAADPSLPHLKLLGLGCLPGQGYGSDGAPLGAWGLMTERAAGKDTTSGHWEIAGLTLHEPLPTYPDGFPPEVIDAFVRATGRGVLGNRTASGTQIIEELGEEHLRTGKLIVYTSADSVFQIAAHESAVPPEELWAICRKARAILRAPHNVGRVIARPFVGEPGSFTRTGNRRDFSLEPPGDTLLDVLARTGLDVWGVGKIEDIFAHRGLTESDHAAGNAACVEALLRMEEREPDGLIFVNLVDTDSVYGHRRDPDGFARCLEAFDRALPDIVRRMGDEDLLIITADHGCDPCFPGTDHTRERVPLLCWGPHVRPGSLGIRETFADVSATVLDWFGLDDPLDGQSFKPQILLRPEEQPKWKR